MRPSAGTVTEHALGVGASYSNAPALAWPAYPARLYLQEQHANVGRLEIAIATLSLDEAPVQISPLRGGTAQLFLAPSLSTLSRNKEQAKAFGYLHRLASQKAGWNDNGHATRRR